MKQKNKIFTNLFAFRLDKNNFPPLPLISLKYFQSNYDKERKTERNKEC